MADHQPPPPPRNTYAGTGAAGRSAAYGESTSSSLAGARGAAPADPGQQGLKAPDDPPAGVSGAAAATWTAIHHARALIDNWALAGAGKVGMRAPRKPVRWIF